MTSVEQKEDEKCSLFFLYTYNESQWGPKLVWTKISSFCRRKKSYRFGMMWTISITHLKALCSSEIPNQVHPNGPINDIHLYWQTFKLYIQQDSNLWPLALDAWNVPLCHNTSRMTSRHRVNGNTFPGKQINGKREHTLNRVTGSEFVLCRHFHI